jgi:hypothetical protein
VTEHRYYRESGNPEPQQLPWVPAFARTTIEISGVDRVLGDYCGEALFLGDGDA